MAITSPPEKPRISSIFKSQILTKFGTGITGILLILYLAQHLLANIRIFSSDPLAVSKYGHALQQFGPLLLAIELALATVIIFHVCLGLAIWIKKRKARPVAYHHGNNSKLSNRESWASRTMIWGGLLILAFLVLHVAYFRFGPGIAEGYAATINGSDARHYERLVRERFAHPGYVLFYCISMIAVGLHLSHGFWSAFQSLGLVKDENRRVIHWTGVIVAAVFTLGFMSIPLMLYFA